MMLQGRDGTGTRSPARSDARWIWAVASALLSLVAVGFPWIAMKKPLGFSGDGLFLHVLIKNFIDHGGLWSVRDLGFPGLQDYAYFPLFDFSYKLIAYALTLVSHNPFVVSNLFYMTAISLMAVFAFLGLSSLGFKAWLSCLAAIAFTASPYLCARLAVHDFLALYYGVPLGATLSLLLLTRWSPANPRFAPTWLLVATIAVNGTSGLYYGFFTALFLGAAGFAAAVRHRRPTPLVIAAAASLAMLGMLVVVGYGPALPRVLSGQIPQPQRVPIEQYLYGLNIADAFHNLLDLGLFKSRLPDFQALSTRMPTPSLTEWPGAVFSAIILSSPLIVLAGYREASGPGSRAQRLVMASACLIVLGLLFATRGGLGQIFNFVVSPSIRAHARILPFLSFFSIVIFCAAVEIVQRQPKAVLRNIAVSAMLAAATISLLPYLGQLPVRQKRTSASPIRQQNLAGIRTMLLAKDQHGITTILQLPVVEWPEVPDVRNFSAYDHQLPYILDRARSGTRWSYGQAGPDPSFRLLRAKLDNTPPARLPSLAVGLGFDGLLIEKAAYAPEALDTLLAALRATIKPACVAFEDRFRILMRLGPRSNGDACLSAPPSASAPETSVSFKFMAESPGKELLLSGWRPSEYTHTWSSASDASLLLPVPKDASPGRDTTSIDLLIDVYRPTPVVQDRLELLMGEKRLAVEDFQGAAPSRRVLRASIPNSSLPKDGFIPVELRLSHVAGGDGVPLAIAIIEGSVSR